MEIVLSWSHNGTIVIEEEESIALFPVNLNHNLVIYNAAVEDSGLYTCRGMLGNKVIERNISVTAVEGTYIYYFVYSFIQYVCT